MFLALEGFWLVIVSILAFIVVLGLIIVLHEFGHFVVARLSGITCYEFSIGMGPALYKKDLKGTTFALRAIPIGGYVSMANEEASLNTLKPGMEVGLILDDSKITKIILDPNINADLRGQITETDMYNENGEGMFITIQMDDGLTDTYLLAENCVYVLDSKETQAITPYDKCFESKPIWKRFLTLLAGPLMNFILAIVLYFIYFCAIGVPNLDSNVIGETSYGYAAYEVLKPGDIITSVNGEEITSWKEFSSKLNNKENLAEITITVNRNGKEVIAIIPYSIIVNSIGLTNLQMSDYTYPEGITGAKVGNVGLNYLNSSDKDKPYALAPGDVITKLRVDSLLDKNTIIPGEVVEVKSWQDLVNALNSTDIANVYFEYYSQKKAKDNPDNPYVSLEASSPVRSWGNEMLDNQRVNKIEFKLGVSPVYHFDFGGVFVSTFKAFWKDFTLIFRTLQLLIAPSGIRQVGVESLSSFVGIFGMVQNVVRNGILPLLAFTAMLSINIGIINLLPIPALDGGRIVFLLYELITRRKPNPKVEAVLNNIFFVLLLILLIYVTINDIRRLNFVFDMVRRL